MTRIEAIAEGCQQFENDQVHLTGASGQIFVEGLLSKSEAFFAAPIVNLTNDDEEMTTEDKSITDLLTERLDKLESQVKSRRNEDNVIFARQLLRGQVLLIHRRCREVRAPAQTVRAGRCIS